MEAKRLEPVPGVVVYRYGDGPRPVVALHGWSGDHRTFEPLAKYLRPEQSLYSFDQPGSGESASPAEWTMDAYVSPMLDALDALGVHRFELIGNCAGAVFAFELAVRAKERVQRIIAIDPFAYVPWYFRLLTSPFLGRLFYMFTFANPLGRWLTDGALRSKRTDESSLTKSFEAVRHDDAFMTLSLLCTLDDWYRYSPINAPVLLLQGEKTFGAVRRSVQIYHALWPRSRVAILEGAGHLPIRETEPAVGAYCFQGVAPIHAVESRSSGLERQRLETRAQGQ